MSEASPVDVSPSVVASAVVEQVAPQAPVTPELTVVPEVKAEESPKEDDKFAHKFAALSRKEKAILAKEHGLKESLAKIKAFEDEQGHFDRDPLDYIQKRFGKDYKYLTDRVLNNNEITPEQKVDQIQKKLEEFEQAQKEKEKSQVQKKYEETISAFTSEIGQFISSNAEVYEFTNANPEGAAIVYNVIEQHHTKTGRIMSTEEAVKSVEAFLEAEADKILSLGKVKKKFAPAPIEDKKPAPSSATLTNALSTGGPTPTQNKTMNIEESKREAARLLKWS